MRDSGTKHQIFFLREVVEWGGGVTNLIGGIML